MDSRRFHRVKFHAASSVSHLGMTYRGRLENISLRGAMISANEFIMVPLGERCTLSITLDSEESPLIVTAEVVHSFFSMVGVRFVAFADDEENRLLELLRKITDKPEKLIQEWQELQAKR